MEGARHIPGVTTRWQCAVGNKERELKLKQLWDRVRYFNRDVELDRTLDAVRVRLAVRVDRLKKYTPRQRTKILAQDLFYQRVDAVRKELDKFDREMGRI